MAPLPLSLRLECVYAGDGQRMVFRDFDGLNAYMDAVQVKAATFTPRVLAAMKTALAQFSPQQKAGTLTEDELKTFVQCVLFLSIVGQIPNDAGHGTNLVGEVGKCTFACDNFAAMPAPARRAYQANIESMVALATAAD